MRLGLFVIAVSLMANVGRQAQPRLDGQPIRVTLSDQIDISECQMIYQLIGSFGEYGGFAEPKPGDTAFEIEPEHEGKPVKSVKGYIYCPGYQFDIFAFDALADENQRGVERSLTPLGVVPFAGIVRGVVPSSGQHPYLEVKFNQWWSCEFFRMIDCGLGGITVAKVELTSDGGFATMLPDFARDRVVGAYSHRDRFVFVIRDRVTLNNLFWLSELGAQSRFELAVAPAYSGEHVFDAWIYQ